MKVNIDYQLLPVNLPIFIAYFTCELNVVTQYDKNLNGVLTSAVTECLSLEVSLKDMNLQVSALIRKNIPNVHPNVLPKTDEVSKT